MLAACGFADPEPEVPAATPAAVMGASDAMAKGDEAAKTEDSIMAQTDAAAKVEDSTMVQMDALAMAEDSAMAKDDEAAMTESHDAEGDTAMAEDAAMALPAWLTAKLVDVTTGQPFAVADQQGKVVLMETLAVWCSNCLRQQKEIQALHTALGEREDLVSLGLDIDLNKSPKQLKAHAERHGFDWTPMP